MNAEIIERLKASYAVPDDVVAACLKNPDVEDRFEFAVRVLQKAGVNVNIPTDDQL
jgi:Fe-S oxidoreductase